ncbi:3-deoxy-D-manno-octulosonic acid transferase [Candidatus Filomicrobium marinum]|uniref:3-deoxy-D-manno-octulosonic acid transferase n=4 Tax=Hyphomicrobiaceae TaxID=45401 RepID=A0A0D6J9L0_9HYPH|nr:DUF374 domain-containing protein [Filomicrobium sp.]CFW99083.1 3-deoxy-D-manno-octulosonic acid transferase [Candidatus Filomicrobium marinum]CPR15001.1 3-deoxy-D-manno-octulosonic acid transferase [Candidatus Filomicrobium marinum]SDO72102.1 3-deoxy-D-manno-octulosonic-acid transferase [Filomicrobium insigne]
MALSPKLKTTLGRAGGRIIARTIRLVEQTSTFVGEPPDLQERMRALHPAIMACWHGQFMMLASPAPKELRFAAMVARHGDAELVGEAMSRLGHQLIRGAGAGDRRKDRGGAHALRASLKALADNTNIVMTADVPPGPARRCGQGIITLARLSGRPILPIAAATSRYHALDTWSRMTINLPYSTFGYVLGDPIYVPDDASPEQMEQLRQRLETALNNATARAYELAGADPARATPPGAADPSTPPVPAGFRLKSYRVATRIIQPVAPLILRFRENKGKEDPTRRNERFGQSNLARPEGPLVWIHAASVGETNAILPVVDTLTALRPDVRCLLTTGTLTSARLAAQRLGPNAFHQFLPLDSPEYARRFLERWQPDVAVLTESEIWPNLILEAHAREIPLVLVNARMSNRSFKRWRRNTSMAAALFTRFDLVLTQNDKFARWYSELGARRVRSIGNLKIDAPPPPIDQAAFDALAAAVNSRRGYVATSTHEGEEEIIGEAHRRLANEFEGFLTLLAPRHPERGTAIAEALKMNGLNVTQRSENKLPDTRTDVYIADTIGELGTLYALAPIAFIGGSLVDKGGQNPIEAVRHHAAVLTGPSWHNFRDAYDALKRHDAMREVRSSEELAAAVAELMHDDAKLNTMRANADLAIGTLSGALDQTIAALLHYLPDQEGMKRAS